MQSRSWNHARSPVSLATEPLSAQVEVPIASQKKSVSAKTSLSTSSSTSFGHLGDPVSISSGGAASNTSAPNGPKGPPSVTHPSTVSSKSPSPEHCSKIQQEVLKNAIITASTTDGHDAWGVSQKELNFVLPPGVFEGLSTDCRAVSLPI